LSTAIGQIRSSDCDDLIKATRVLLIRLFLYADRSAATRRKRPVTQDDRQRPAARPTARVGSRSLAICATLLKIDDDNDWPMFVRARLVVRRWYSAARPSSRMATPRISIGVCQLNSNEDKQVNWQIARRLIEQGKAQQAKVRVE
jgi:hypothetical protein